MTDQVCHLHVHTEFSILDGAAKIAALFAEAARLGQPAVAMTDHGNAHGAFAFWREAAKHGVTPIIGMEAYMAPGDRTHREPVLWGTPEQRSADVGGGGAHTHLTLLAENATGLRNLFRLTSEASATGFYRKPRVDRELLARHSEGIIATTGCLGGEISTRLRLGQHDAALRAAGEMRDIFGDRYYLEVMDHGIADERALRPALLRLRDQLGLPVVATNDSHYVTPDQVTAHDALLCVQTRAQVADPDRFRFDGSGYHLRSAAEMRDYWDRELPGACDTTLQIAERVGPYDEVFAFVDRMPQFPLPDGETSAAAWLAKEVERGLARRYPDGLPADRRERADYELGIIDTTGFPGYFLIVADLCAHCRDRGIRTNTRGSAAGSIVAYALGITDLDPIAHSLLFERFLNPERVSPPDVDLDVDESRRGEIVRYLTDRWGSERVAQIATFGRIKGKAAIKDATRVLGHPYSLGDRLTKAYPPAVMGFDAPLAVVTDPQHARHGEAAELRSIIAAESEAAEVFALATGLEGLVRQTGVHAAGVILSREPLANVLPLWSRDDGAVIAGFDYPSCEEMGLLKVDVLGSRNLAILDEALANIRAQRGEEIDLLDVPLDDKPTFDLLARGDTLGVFQLDGGPIRALLRKLVPTRFGDIGAVIALYRPGPMGANAHNDYADRKNGRIPIKPIHPELADVLTPVLGETYGVICYQEQVIEVAQRVAGYTLGRADILRRAMGKKKPAELAKEKPAFFAGMAANGFGEESAAALWDVLLPFSAYAFNRAHAASYAMIGYWTAYLKANYPAEYMAALLTSVRDDKDRMGLYLAEARTMGVRVLSPDVNDSGARFTVVGTDIRYGLGQVRNVGEGVVASILRERKNGPYADFGDYLMRSDRAALGKRAVASLIEAGAFDSLGVTRAGLHSQHEAAIDAAVALSKSREIGQFDLFSATGDLAAPRIDLDREIPEWPRADRLAREREVLGLYVSDHPLSGREAELAGYRTVGLAALADDSGPGDRAPVTVAGLVTAADRKTNRDGRPWALLTLEDTEGVAEVCVFPKSYAEHADLCAVDQVIAVRGRVNRRDAGVSVVASEIVALPPADQDTAPVVLDVPADRARRLARVLASHPGESTVHLRISDTVTLALDDYRVADCAELRAAVAELG